jgi:hypothetical protein
MTNTAYPYEGFEDMFPGAEHTPGWQGFGHKNLVYGSTPVKHIILADGQQHSEVDMYDPDEPLDTAVVNTLRGMPIERAPFPVSNELSIYRTERPNARLGMEYGQFNHPDTRPGLLGHVLRIDPLSNPTSNSPFFQNVAGMPVGGAEPYHPSGGGGFFSGIGAFFQKRRGRRLSGYKPAPTQPLGYINAAGK